MTNDLASLATALEQATGPSGQLDERLGVEVFGWALWLPIGREGALLKYPPPAYTAEIDAITRSLHRLWPDRFWSVAVEPRRYGSQSSARLWRWDLEDGDLDVIEATHRPHCPALALCLAAVRLRIAEGDAGR